MDDKSPSEKILSAITGYWISQAIYVAAKLGIADYLKDGPLDHQELANRAGVDAQSLYRVLRALASAGLFQEIKGRQFQLTPIAETLCADTPHSLAPAAVMFCEESYRAWGELLYSVKSGEPAFEHVFNMPRFAYLEQHAGAAGIFNRAMASLFGRVHTAVAMAYEFSAFQEVVDVGGGNGSLLAQILRASPTSRGVLFEIPAVLEDAKRYIEAAKLASRCECVSGDFFTAIPEGGDAYILSHVLQSFDDDRCIEILRNCHKVLAAKSKLLIVEPVISPGNDPSFAKLLDLHMLVVTGGRLRTEVEYRALLSEAGLQPTRIIPTEAGESLIEAVR